MKKNRLRELKDDNKGMGVIEIILIIVVLVGLVLIFKDQISGVVEDIFEAISSGVSDVIS